MPHRRPITRQILGAAALAGLSLLGTAACGDAVGSGTEDATETTFYKCVLEGDEPVIDHAGKWGEVGEWCDPAALDEPGVAGTVEQRYPGLVVPSRTASWEVRRPILAKLVKVITVSIHIALEERGLRSEWSREEIDAFTLAVLAEIYQDSYFGQYKRVDGELMLMRGAKGRAHGLMQLGEAEHFDAIYGDGAGWDLLGNLRYGLDLFIDAWRSQKTDSICAPAGDYQALARSAYAVFKSGDTRNGCRWDDAPTGADESYLKRYQQLASEDLEATYGWVTSYPDALEGVEDIDFEGILGIPQLPGQTPGPDCGEVDAEPNGSAADAFKLTSTDDCDGNGNETTGVLAGPGDADWYYYEGYDAGLCVVNPTVELSATAEGVSTCMFFRCVQGELSTPSCPSGTTAASSDVGPGCCGEVASMTVDGLNCSDTNAEDIDVYISVERPGASETACTDYQLKYHY